MENNSNSDQCNESTPPILRVHPPISRFRWGIHLGLFILYPVIIGLLSLLVGEESTGPALPSDTKGLLLVSFEQMLIFSAFFFIATFFSKPNIAQLGLRWNGGMMPIILGGVYSIVVRIGIALITFIIVGILFLSQKMDEETLQNLRPQTENLIDAEALTEDPVYLFLMLTLVSFGVAGFREELWRVCMMIGLEKAFPTIFGGRWGKILAVGCTAILFGFGHTAQGWGAVGLTTLLGVGFGMIILYHKSIWEAVIAHGFFDATSMIFLAIISKYYPTILQGL